MTTLKKLLLLPICAIVCMFSQIDSVWAIDYPFSLTTSATNEFSFNLSAQGTFYVDCGTGGTLSGTGVSGGTITKNNTTNYTYTCSYSNSAIRTIRFGGTATNYTLETKYTTLTHVATISFYAGSNDTNSKANAAKITAISGNLSTIFPYISTNDITGAQPSFIETFGYAVNLQSVPGTLFSEYTIGASGMFYRTFVFCAGLQSISSDLFKNITMAAFRTFSGTFGSCNLQTIPSGLFANITTLASQSTFVFAGTFSSNHGLQTIPSDLFAGITTGSGSMFHDTFSGCTGLQTIPSDLFKNITTGVDSMFVSTFESCTGLQTIPSDLFKNITTSASGMFTTTFRFCTGLQTIPSDLFKNITTGANAMFSGTFYGCTGLQTIPSDLFKNITTGAQNMFQQTFYGCSNLTGYIPSTLFAGLITNNAATNTFNQTFTNTGMAESCPSGTEYATQYTSGWGEKVSCTDSASYSVVSYSCGLGTGTPPTPMTAVSGGSFMPRSGGCAVPSGYNGLSGWLVSGTNDIKPAGTAFTWNYSGDKTLTAQFSPNEIGLTFDGATTTPAMCSFGSTFVPPTPEPRPGYIFTGWKIKAVHAIEKCGIDSFATSVQYCDNRAYTRLNGNAGYDESIYGLTVGSGQWAVEFGYGTVYGMANCNSVDGVDLGTVATITPESSGTYCWCQATGFTASGNAYTSGPQCTTTASSSWVFVSNLDQGNGAADCMNLCSNRCANRACSNQVFIPAVLGAVGQ